MLEKISDYPVLQAEDDGFLMQLRDNVIAPHLDTLGVEGCGSLSECIDELQKASAYAVDKGASLPLYVPVFDDGGAMRGHRAVAVWAGEHVGIPLYGDVEPEIVENLIKGETHASGKLDEGFMSFSPAFRVALVVHHIVQHVAIDSLAAEAFVLGRYDEILFDGPHFEEYGVPSTELVQVCGVVGSRTEWMATSPTAYVGRCGAEPRIDGWVVRVRGARPKRETLLEAWEEIRDRLDEPREAGYTMGGKGAHRPEARGVGAARKRSGHPEVELMCRWVDSALAQKTFPMKGKQKSWKEAVVMLGKAYPSLADRWTADSMRKSYQHYKRRQA